MRGTGRIRAHPAAAALIVVGIVARIAVLASPLGKLDSDEAVVGLMARHILHGQYPTFFWGQNYGGTVEAYLTAVPFAIFGSSELTLKLVAIALSAVAALLVWRIALRITGPVAAAMAGAVTWSWPGVFVWWSTKSRGFFWSGLDFGLLMMLFALRLVEGREQNQDREPDHTQDRRRLLLDWAGFGLVAGLGLWQTSEVVLFGAPALLWVALRRPRCLVGLPVAAVTGFIGAYPWLSANLFAPGPHFVSISGLPDDGGSYSHHLATFFSQGLPLALGLRVPVTEDWLWRPLGVVVTALALAGVLFLLARRRSGLGLILLTVCLLPLIYAAGPGADYVGEGRYLLPLLPLSALLLTTRLVRRGSAALLAVVVATASVVVLLQMSPAMRKVDVNEYAVPASMTGLLQSLEKHDVTTVVTSYWIAYRLEFDSRESISVLPLAAVRYPAAAAMVEDSPASPAWIFLDHSQDAADFAQEIAAEHVSAQSDEVGGFIVYLPAVRLLPSQ